jgi:antitoxin component of RelBE/YafQ-DinJ toxin-antitoxin module
MYEGQLRLVVKARVDEKTKELAKELLQDLGHNAQMFK